MPIPYSAAARPGWRRWLVSLVVAAGVTLALPCHAAPAPGENPVRVLIGFKQPAFVLSASTRASILSRSRERARIAALRGQVGRQLTHTDAVVATLSPAAATALPERPECRLRGRGPPGPRAPASAHDRRGDAPAAGAGAGAVGDRRR